MLKALFRSIIIALLLTGSVSQIVSADVRFYRYDGNMPFVKMMLNMMVAMGILDRVSPYGSYGSYGYSGLGLYGYNNPFW